jgi:hypothetical protein
MVQTFEDTATQDPAAAGLASALGQTSKTVTIHPDPDNEEKTQEVTIKKLRANQFVKIFACINELVQNGVVQLTDDAGNLIFGAKGILTQFREVRMILLGGDPALKMLAIATHLDKKVIDQLDALDLAKLLGGTWEINGRFFSQNQTELKAALGPLWSLVEKLTQKKSNPSESTPDSSTSSSPEDTEASTK